MKHNSQVNGRKAIVVMYRSPTKIGDSKKTAKKLSLIYHPELRKGRGGLGASKGKKADHRKMRQGNIW